jgi:predicted anti-sigma-YlaC factor YlaD
VSANLHDRNLHERAERLIAQERVEGLADSDAGWLASHLNECAACSDLSESMNRALASMRANGVELPRGLAARTQLRVHLRASELREHSPTRRVLWAITAASWGLGVATAPWIWRGFAWFGEHTGLPRPLWQMGFVLWWVIPALAAVAAVVLDKKDAPQGN